MLKLTYCTNVHPLHSLEEWMTKIGYFGPKIKYLLNKKHLPLGLWFNSSLAEELIGNNFSDLGIVGDFMEKNSLSVFTLNTFPFGNFHEPVVKNKVYRPAWYREARKNYTLNCARILARLMEGDFGTLSTLPLGWREGWDHDKFKSSAEQLLECVQELIRLREETGKQIQICLEPEPGCVLEKISQVIDFWNDWIRPLADKWKIEPSLLNDHLGICYDTCHQAVQFEDPEEVLSNLQKSGIPIGKMQLSNALEFKPDPHRLSQGLREEYTEKRFLHQTRIQTQDAIHQYDDLENVLRSRDSLWAYPWRVHYHLPLFAQDVLESENIQTTAHSLRSAYRYARKNNLTQHFEIETYTWSVLPAALKPSSDEALAQGIAKEFEYIYNLESELQET